MPDFADLEKKFDGLSDEVIKETKKLLADESSKMAKNISSDSPVRKSGTSMDKHGKKLPRGTYAKSWKSKLISETDKGISYRIYNTSKQNPLVHLLEFGHHGVSDARAFPHVLKNRNAIETEIEDKLDETIGKAIDGSMK